MLRAWVRHLSPLLRTGRLPRGAGHRPAPRQDPRRGSWALVTASACPVCHSVRSRRPRLLTGCSSSAVLPRAHRHLMAVVAAAAASPPSPSVSVEKLLPAPAALTEVKMGCD